MRSASDISLKPVYHFRHHHVLYVYLTIALKVVYFRDIISYLFMYCSTILPFWFMLSTLSFIFYRMALYEYALIMRNTLENA